jgi:hypothetical protein
MQYRRFAVVCFVSLLIGLLAGFVLTNMAHKPVLVSMTGTVEVDSATHEDSRLDNRAYLSGLVGLDALVYLTKVDGTANTDDPHRWVGKTVTVDGELVAFDVQAARPVLELRVNHIAPSEPAQNLTPKTP